MGIISNAKLKLMIERADAATGRGLSGPFTLDHSQFLGFQHIIGDKKPHKQLFATSHYGIANAALRCASSADPDTIRELVRGYRLAKEAGLLTSSVAEPKAAVLADKSAP